MFCSVRYLRLPCGKNAEEVLNVCTLQAQELLLKMDLQRK